MLPQWSSVFAVSCADAHPCIFNLNIKPKVDCLLGSLARTSSPFLNSSRNAHPKSGRIQICETNSSVPSAEGRRSR